MKTATKEYLELIASKVVFGSEANLAGAESNSHLLRFDNERCRNKTAEGFARKRKNKAARASRKRNRQR